MKIGLRVHICKLHFGSQKGPEHFSTHFLRSTLAWETSVELTEQSDLFANRGTFKYRSDSPPKAQELVADGNNAKHVWYDEGSAHHTSS